jgi:hypothetical protein
MIDEEVVPMATLGPYKRMSAHRRFGRAVKVSPRHSLLIQMMSWPENVHERFEVFQREEESLCTPCTSKNVLFKTELGKTLQDSYY